MNQINNLEKLPTTIDPAVAAAMLVPERLNNQSLHAEAVQNAIFQRVRARLVADGKGQPREVIENYRSVLAEDPQLRGHIRLNLLTDRVDIVGDIGWQREGAALTGNGAVKPGRSPTGRPAGAAACRGSSGPRKEVLKDTRAPWKRDILRAKEETKT